MSDRSSYVRVAIDWNGSRWFFRRWLENGSPEIVTPQEVQQSLLLDRPSAVVLRSRLRELGYQADIINRQGDVLFDTAPAPGSTLPPAHSGVAEIPLVDHHAIVNGIDIRIVPAARPLGKWLIRFPSCPQQLIRADSPDEAVDILVRSYPQLIHLAERNTPPKQ